MAIYNCECGLTISTSSVRPRCLRCLRVLGTDPRDRERDAVRQSRDGGDGTIIVRPDHRTTATGAPLGQSM